MVNIKATNSPISRMYTKRWNVEVYIHDILLPFEG